MGREITILRGSSGLNNVVDPARLKFSPTTGTSELKAAVNVEIDETGRINRRKGSELLTELAGAHSLFEYSNDCFVAADGNLYRVNSDYTLLGLRSGMTKTAKLSYAGVGDKVFYVNGYEIGVINLFDVSFPWTTSTYSGDLDSREYYDPPTGQLVMATLGRIYIAEGDVIWYSEPFAYSLFRKARSFYQMKSRVTMMTPVDGGFFVGTQEGTYFINTTHDIRQVTNGRAVLGSNEVLPQGAIPSLEWVGRVALWVESDGIWAGSGMGNAMNLTDGRLVLTDGATSGSTVLRDDGVIVTAIM